MSPEQRPPCILVAWDGSPAAATAFALAKTVAAQLDGYIEALHIQSPAAVDSSLVDAVRAAADKLDGVELRVRVGEPAAEIIKASQEEDVSLIVMTHHGRDIEPRRGMGHVAEDVVRGTHQPVLLVNPEVAIGRGSGNLKRLLLPLDGTPQTAVALRPAAELAARLGARVDLLYVAPPEQARPSERGSMAAPRYVDQPQHEWPEWAGEAIRRLALSCAGLPSSVDVQMFMTQGSVGEEIIRFACEHGSDAIVMVRRSRMQPGRARALREVLQRAPCPILLLGGPEIDAHGVGN